MSWQHALELMALGVILVCGVALYVEEVRERRQMPDNVRSLFTVPKG